MAITAYGDVPLNGGDFKFNVEQAVEAVQSHKQIAQTVQQLIAVAAAQIAAISGSGFGALFLSAWIAGLTAMITAWQQQMEKEERMASQLRTNITETVRTQGATAEEMEALARQIR